MKKLYAIIILSFFSILNAIYLTIWAFNYKAWDTSELFCDVSSTFSCSSLFSFDFAWIFWIIPFPLLAMIVYPIIAIIAFMWVKKVIKNPFLPILILWIWWMLFNSYIIYNEYLVWIYCLACLACSFAITTIAIISSFGLRNKKV